MPTQMEQGRRILEVPLDEITPYYRNPRKISEEAVSAVARSIEKYGYNQLIVLDRDGIIVVGHTRYRALQALNVPKALCLIIDASPEKMAEYRLVDNKTNEYSEWDMPKLITEFRLTDTSGLQEYFGPMDIDALMRQGVGTLPDHAPGVFDRYEESRQSHFSNRVAAVVEGYVDVTCPACASRFAIRKHDILTRPD